MRKQYLGLTIAQITQIATSPLPEQIRFQDEFQKVLQALNLPKAQYPAEHKTEYLQIRKRYKRSLQSGRRGRARPTDLIKQGVTMFENDRATSNLRPRKDSEIDLEFWLNDPEFMKE